VSGIVQTLHARQKPRLARAPSIAGLPQRIVLGFVQALDFAAVEALIPDLHQAPKALGMRKSSTA
jgi:hypothetical protein